MTKVQVETIQTATIHEIPTRYEAVYTARGEEYPEQVPDVDAMGLSEPFVSAVQRVADTVDEATCDAPDCARPIGWHIYEDDEAPGGGGLSFYTFVVVVLPGKTTSTRPATVCEDCDPFMFYDQHKP